MKTITRRLATGQATGLGGCRPRLCISRLRVPRTKIRRVYRPMVKAAVEGRDSDPVSDSLVRDALRQISTYCGKLPEDSLEATDCWDAYNYFANEAVAAEDECDLESPSTGMSGKACTNFLSWESFVRQVESSGGVKQMVKTILAVKKAKTSEAVPTTPRKKSSIVPASDILDELCEKLFDMKDRNKDGRIDVEEFRSLMKLLGDEVSGETVSVMFEAMDIHGSLDFEEFLAILEAESIRSHSQSAGVLRSTQRHGHYGDRPKWLDNV